MIKRKIRNVNKALTDEERARHARIRGEIEQEKPDLIALGTACQGAAQQIAGSRRRSSRPRREALGLTLADIKARTGIEKGNLSRLEKLRRTPIQRSKH